MLRDLKYYLHGRQCTSLGKFVFCRPRAGFNDNLAQVSKCLTYCLEYHRVLVVSNIRACQIKAFELYLEVISCARKSISLRDSVKHILGNPSIFPGSLSWFADDFVGVYSPELKRHIDAASGVVVTFEKQPYPHDILIHEQCGGGPGWPTLERLRFTPGACRAIHETLQILPDSYSSVHVRNTDLKTDCIEFFKSISSVIDATNPCLLCTDDPGVIGLARQVMSHIQFLSLYPFPPNLNPSEPLHYSPKTKGWEFDIGMLSDLVAMARAEHLFIASGVNRVISGFGALALDLHRRPHIVKRLMRGL